MAGELELERLLGQIFAKLSRLEERISLDALPTVLTRQRAAEELSISVTTLQRLIRRGDVLTVMVLDRAMVPKSEVQKYATATRAGERPMERPAPPPAPAEARQAAKGEADALRAQLREEAKLRRLARKLQD